VAGAGLGGIPHKFFYTDEKENYSVLQFASQTAGASSLAAYVQEAAEAAIKASLLITNASNSKREQASGAVQSACVFCDGGDLSLPAAVQERGAFTLVLSGGSLLKALSALIGLPNVDFGKWHIFFVDERNVPHSSPDSNYKGAYDAFLSKVQAPSIANALEPVSRDQGMATPMMATLQRDKMSHLCRSAGAHPSRADLCHSGELACLGSCHGVRRTAAQAG
jgi:hypothetical protein